MLWRYALILLLFSTTALQFVSGSEAQDKQSRVQPRRLAPGVLTVIPVKPEAAETASPPRGIVEILFGVDKQVLNWQPHFTPASRTLKQLGSQVVLRRGIWQLEFAFKPLRMIEVDVPQASGKMRRKLVWYLVYRLKNSGLHLNPVGKKDRFGSTSYELETINHTVRCFPQLVLRSHEYDKEYLDQLIPVAVGQIQQREDPAIKLHNSVEISRLNIPLSDEQVQRSVWGVATWTDIDPRIDFFSILVEGLSNAYHWEDTPGVYQQGDPPGTGRRYTQKTLQLNFWRPGDAVLQHEGEIRFGLPFAADPDEQMRFFKQYGLQERVDYLWVYR